MNLERKLFSVRLQAPLPQTLRAVGMGLAGGLFISLLVGVLGLVIQERDIWLLWLLAVVLALFQVRYLCLAYAAGLLTLLHSLALMWPAAGQTGGLGQFWLWLGEAKPVPLLALVAVMHLAESFLVNWNGGRDASPLFLEGKRGRIIGGYQLHSFWLTPLFLLVETAPGSGFTSPLYPGWPLFSSELTPYLLVLLPAVTGFSDLTTTMPPRQKAGEIAAGLFWYAIVLLALAYGSVWWPPLMILAALFAFAGHEGLFLLSQRRENRTPPFFIQSPRGVKVMGIIPGTPAEEMGIQPGEVLVKVNGLPVRKREDLYPALHVNPAFCKMEVMTLQGEIKFVQCAVYAGHHHQLGIIVVPDEETRYFVDIHKASVIQLVKQQLRKVRKGA